MSGYLYQYYPIISQTVKRAAWPRRLSKNRDPTTGKSLLAIFPEHFS